MDTCNEVGWGKDGGVSPFDYSKHNHLHLSEHLVRRQQPQGKHPKAKFHPQMWKWELARTQTNSQRSWTTLPNPIQGELLSFPYNGAKN
jgi:hypothetical protein